MKHTKTILEGNQWNKYLKDNSFSNLSQLQLYYCTYNYTPIYKIGDYYFSFNIKKGYTNISSLKKLI